MKRLRGCVDAEADERERPGIAEREGCERAGSEHRRQLVAAHPAQGRVGESREYRRVHGDEQQHRGGDSGRDRGQLRGLGDDQRRDEQRAEQREGGLVGHARKRHPGRDSGGGGSRDADRRHQQAGRHVAPQRRKAPRAQARDRGDLASEPAQHMPPQRRVRELRSEEAEHGENGPPGGEAQLDVGKLPRLGQDRERDPHRDERRQRREQRAAQTGADPGHRRPREARRHVRAVHAASFAKRARR